MKLPTSDEVCDYALRTAIRDVLYNKMTEGERAGAYRIIHAAGWSGVMDIPFKRLVEVYALCCRTVENRK